MQVDVRDKWESVPRPCSFNDDICPAVWGAGVETPFLPSGLSPTEIRENSFLALNGRSLATFEKQARTIKLKP
ncbi:MAG: hypothetical protein ACKO9H_08905, partial [Planctomycetota bacterium]